jgi:hypothetical protein
VPCQNSGCISSGVRAEQGASALNRVIPPQVHTAADNNGTVAHLNQYSTDLVSTKHEIVRPLEINIYIDTVAEDTTHRHTSDQGDECSIRQIPMGSKGNRSEHAAIGLGPHPSLPSAARNLLVGDDKDRKPVTFPSAPSLILGTFDCAEAEDAVLCSHITIL